MQRWWVPGVEQDGKEIRWAPTSPSTTAGISCKAGLAGPAPPLACESGLQAAGIQSAAWTAQTELGGGWRGEEMPQTPPLTPSGQQLPYGFRSGEGHRTQGCLLPTPEPRV